MSQHPMKRQWIVRAGGVIVAIAGVGLVYAMVHSFLANLDRPHKPTIQQIVVLRPPPPPPPPKVDQPPPPQMKREEVKLPDPDKPDDPKPPDDQPPPAPNLGLDAEGTAGSDAFGLAAHKGGRDITTIGGGGGSRFGRYGSVLQQELQRALARDDRLRKRDYRVIVQIWLTPQGGVQRFELVDSSGNPQTDAELKVALNGVHQLAEAPPADMPQPVKVRVTSRL